MNIEKFNPTPNNYAEDEKITFEKDPKMNEYIEVAVKALKDYVGLNESKEMLIIRDEIANPKTAEILKKAARELEAEIKEIYLDENVGREDVQKLLSAGETVVKLSQSSHPALKELYNEDLENIKYRLLNLMDLSPEAFKKDGPIAESADDIERRLNKMHHELKKAVGFKVTSSYGTNLEIGLRDFKERDWFKESGKLEDGKWGNLPSGEIFTTPDEFKANGVLVLPVLDSEMDESQGVDEFVRINIKDGIITSIEGGESAKIMRESLQLDMQNELDEMQNPYHVLRIAEIAFGANSKAQHRAINPEGDYKEAGVSTVEAEKRLGTMHIAFGSGDHGEKEADGFLKDVGSHYDFVIPRHGLTVEKFTSEDDFKKKKNARKFISDGGLNFL
ncbi:MAG: aminopeptidase [Patescibacteria group bacterium]